MLPAISPAVISHLAMPNSGVRRYAAALQSLVSAGARDRLARAEEPVVCRLCARGGRIRTLGPPSEGCMQTPRSPPIASSGGADRRKPAVHDCLRRGSRVAYIAEYRTALRRDQCFVLELRAPGRHARYMTGLLSTGISFPASARLLEEEDSLPIAFHADHRPIASSISESENVLTLVSRKLPAGP
jgi:hypothetical protein